MLDPTIYQHGERFCLCFACLTNLLDCEFLTGKNSVYSFWSSRNLAQERTRIVTENGGMGKVMRKAFDEISEQRPA